MDASSDAITINPIGYIRSEFTDYAPSDIMRRHPSQIVVSPDFAPGLMGLSPGDRILILFILHRALSRGYELQLHPGHNPENPRRGVFATRSQYRPNYIAATIASITAIAADAATGTATLSVTGLDAQDGSPVIDIKPYRPEFDNPGLDAPGLDAAGP